MENWSRCSEKHEKQTICYVIHDFHTRGITIVLRIC